MDWIEKKLQEENVYYSGASWLPDFLTPIPRPFCSHDQALNILERFKIDDKWKTEAELDELLREYGIFSYGKWMEEKDKQD